ncbi:putative nitrilase [Aspergillus novoparasiticus]|uniref:nitrilase n=1 Tax=Aspergillus novoparasiticus TaxID=986946 RepID=A0A5N6EKI3_9EURO|nr:putative nitrilase [Aspergillus novoparasiticus]
MTQVRVGAVQAEPAWVDLAGSVAKTIALIQEAGAKGINVLGFPEVWIPGYLWAMWTGSVVDNMELMHQYMANSLARNSPEMDAIRQAVKEAGIFIVLGYSERDGGSLYMAQSFIDPAGEIVHHRRKIKPTHVERSIWGEGQAESLQTVVDSPFGRIGGLNCWEHLQPLLRFYEYSQGVQIHIASWPAEFPEPKGMKWPFHETDGQAFVLVCTQVVKKESLEKQNLIEAGIIQTPSGGFSMIFGPDGGSLVEGPPAGEERILQADINLQDIDYAKAMIDTVGHYSRPDLLSLQVNTEAAKCVRITGEGINDKS